MFSLNYLAPNTSVFLRGNGFRKPFLPRTLRKDRADAGRNIRATLRPKDLDLLRRLWLPAGGGRPSSFLANHQHDDALASPDGSGATLLAQARRFTPIRQTDFVDPQTVLFANLVKSFRRTDRGIIA